MSPYWLSFIGLIHTSEIIRDLIIITIIVSTILSPLTTTHQSHLTWWPRKQLPDIARTNNKKEPDNTRLNFSEMQIEFVNYLLKLQYIFSAKLLCKASLNKLFILAQNFFFTENFIKLKLISCLRHFQQIGQQWEVSNLYKNNTILEIVISRK